MEFTIPESKPGPALPDRAAALAAVPSKFEEDPPLANSGVLRGWGEVIKADNDDNDIPPDKINISREELQMVRQSRPRESLPASVTPNPSCCLLQENVRLLEKAVEQGRYHTPSTLAVLESMIEVRLAKDKNLL